MLGEFVRRAEKEPGKTDFCCTGKIPGLQGKNMNH